MIESGAERAGAARGRRGQRGERRECRPALAAVALALAAACAKEPARRPGAASGELAPGRAYVPPPLRIDPELTVHDVLPAEHGELAGCSVVLITLDTTRANHIGCYGYEAIETPNIDALAARGVLFADAITPNPTTLPAHASMLTGLYPVRHGARVNGAFRLDERHETLAEVLAARGYATAAAPSAFVLDSRFGLDQGFDLFEDHLDGPAGEGWHSERAGAKTTDLGLAWLREHARGPFFLWLHYYDPHAPFQPPSPYRERYAERPYDGEVAYADAQVGRVVAALEELGRTEDTLVVVTADHGEGFGQHVEMAHGYLLYDATLHVPLILACGERLGGGAQVARRVSLVDLMPTILGLLGIEPPEVEGVEGGLDGVDQTAPPAEAPPVFADTLYGFLGHGWSPLYSVSEGRYKYVHGPRPELFDLAADAGETHDIEGAATAEVVARLRARLEALVGAELEGVPALESDVVPDAESQRKIAELGYGNLVVGGHGDAALADPKEMMPILVRIELTLGQARDGLIPRERAIEILEDAVVRRPDFATAYRYLAGLYQKDGQLAKAQETLEAGLEVRPGDHSLANDLARLLMELGRPGDAAAIARRTLAALPASYEAKTLLSDALVRAELWEEAYPLLAEMVRLAPEEEALRNGFVQAALHTENVPAAIALVERVLQADPGQAELRAALVFLLGHESRYADALEVLRAGVRLRPADLEARHTLAVTLLKPPDPALAAPREALGMLEALCAETQRSKPEYLFSLARAHAVLGNRDAACENVEEAHALAEQQGNANVARAALELGRQLGCAR